MAWMNMQNEQKKENINLINYRGIKPYIRQNEFKKPMNKEKSRTCQTVFSKYIRESAANGGLFGLYHQTTVEFANSLNRHLERKG